MVRNNSPSLPPCAQRPLVRLGGLLRALRLHAVAHLAIKAKLALTFLDCLGISSQTIFDLRRRGRIRAGLRLREHAKGHCHKPRYK
jgi:hypothetical protein